MTLAGEYEISGKLSADDLVEQYAPLVKRVALHLLGRLPDGTELDDLIQVGLIALLEAARNYTPSKGASFETYARIRLRGAMLDEVRSSDWAPRSVYRKQRELVTATRAVENRTGHEATPTEVAAEMGVDLDDYHDILADASAARFFSLNQMTEDSDFDPEAPPGGDANPSQNLQKTELMTSVAEAIQELPEREAMVMSLYYVEELNLKEIGAVLGVSESRISQIHSQAVVRLRSRLGEEWGIGDD